MYPSASRSMTTSNCRDMGYIFAFIADGLRMWCTPGARRQWKERFSVLIRVGQISTSLRVARDTGGAGVKPTWRGAIRPQRPTPCLAANRALYATRSSAAPRLLGFTTISTSWPRATRKRMRRSTEYPRN